MKKIKEVLKFIPPALLILLHTALYFICKPSGIGTNIYVFSAILLAALCFIKKLHSFLPILLCACFGADFANIPFSPAATIFAFFCLVLFALLIASNNIEKCKKITGLNRIWYLPAMLYIFSKIIFHIEPARKYAEHFAYLSYFPQTHIFYDDVFWGIIADALFAAAFLALCRALKENEW